MLNNPTAVVDMPVPTATKWSWCDFFAGWGAGVSGLVVGHPFDTLKVRQQTISGNFTIWELTKFTFKHERYKGFFKGLSYPAFMSGIYTSLLFGVYGNTLRFFEDLRKVHPRRMCCEGPPMHDKWHYDVFVAGCVAGTAVVMVSSPVELIKIKLQTQTAQRISGQHLRDSDMYDIREPLYRGPWHAVSTIYQRYGLYRGIYKGLVSMLWRDVWTFGLYMLAYEHILCMFKEEEDRSSKTSLLSQVVAGGIAGILSWILVMPLDVVKSRIQGDDLSKPKYKGIVDCIKRTYRSEGLHGLFHGSVLVSIRAFPSTAITFVVYESLMDQCRGEIKEPEIIEDQELDEDL